MREFLKSVAFAAATVGVIPFFVSYAIRSRMFGRDRALEGSTQMLALLPGMVGDYFRRAFLSRILVRCDRTASIHFGTIFSQTGARLEANVYVGPRCHIGLAHLERDVLLAAGVHVPSGGATHGTADSRRPIRDQPGALAMVRVGEGTWIGSAAIILADVGKHCVIGAGSVVTKPLPDYVVAAGVPARVIKSRRPE